MSKREEFITVINTLKALSSTITSEQRKGLLQQAVQQYNLSTDEADKILKGSGLIVGEKINYFEVLGFSLEELQNQSEKTIVTQVDAAHKKQYNESLRAGGLPRSDGRTQEQWRTLLNQAKETLIDPLKRREYVALHQHNEAERLFNEEVSLIPNPSDVSETIGQELSHQTIPDDVDVPDDMVFIPAGEFQMGSSDEEANEDERPVHAVFVDAFLMDKYPVTNAQYKEFIRANPQWRKPELFEDHIPIDYHDGGYLKDWDYEDYPNGKDEHPVTQVSWYAAMAYAQWIGKRLPTEAEWEKAARGRLERKKYPWGDPIDLDASGYAYELDDTTPVGLSPVNGYGLYDVSGNVWEWCLDAYDADFYASSPHTNPFSGANSVGWIVKNFRSVKVSRVLRGGPWGADSEGVSVSHRFRGNPTDTFPTFGFRCIKEVRHR